MNRNKIRTIILTVALTVSMSSASLLATTNVFASEAGVTSQRLWGNDRYETSVAVSKSGFTTSDTVILVRGDDFADALAVTPLAKMYNAPILLTGVNSLPSSVQAEITRLGAKKIVIAGGIGAVSQTVENSLKKLATVERISGSDRYATSVMIAEELGAKTSIALVTGSDFADGESMAAVAAQMGMPVIFTNKNTLSSTAKQYIADNKVTKTYVIGGTGVISDSVASAVPGMERLSGANRYDTNLAILNKFSNQINFDGVYVATGADFADALTATALAAKNSGAVVLASKSLTAANVSFIKGQITPKTVVTLVGGEKIVPSAIATSLTLDKTDYATDGKTYSAADITSKNINLTGKDITVDGATINGNLYVYGNDTTLSNTTVTGTIFLDPGLTGNVTLKNVKASKIVVQSGATSSINLDSVTAAVLVSQSANSNPSTRIHATGTTAIGATEVQSDVFLNCEAGSFGFVSVTASGSSDKNLELAGTFAPIHLTAPCDFTGTTTPTVYVDAPGVIVSGKIGDLVINTSTAPEFAPGTVINKIIGTDASKGITLTIPAGVTVTQATSDFVLAGAGASSVTVIPPTTVDPTTPPVDIPS
ncbi:cell wall-binding repeat-containing protein, partial [Clostridium sp.]